MAEVKQEVKQENLKEAKAPPVDNNQKSGSPKQPEQPKPDSQKNDQQKKAEPDKPKQETSQKSENSQKQEPDLTQAQAPRDFYKGSENNKDETTYIPGEAPKDTSEKARPKETRKTTEDRREQQKTSEAKGAEKDKGSGDPKHEGKFKDAESSKKSESNKSSESSSKGSADAKHGGSEREVKTEKPNIGSEQRVNQSQKRVEVDSGVKPEGPAAGVRGNEAGVRPEGSVVSASGRREEIGVRPEGSVVSASGRREEIGVRPEGLTTTTSPLPLQKNPSAETKEPQKNIIIEIPQKSVEISKPGLETLRPQPVSTTAQLNKELSSFPQPTPPAQVSQKEITAGRVMETIRQVSPEIAVRLTAQIVERFPIKAEAPAVERKAVTAQRRQDLFKVKVVEPKRIAAPKLNNRIQELIAAVREVSIQRNVVRTRYKVESKKELLKDNTSLLKRLRAEERKESIIFKPLQELDRLVIKYSPPLAVKAASEKILEKLTEARKAPEIMIKVFETVTAISTSAERLLQKLRDPSLEKLLPAETLSKLQGLIQELVRSSLPLGTDPEGLTPERLQSLKSKIEELIAKMREELLHLDLSEDDISDLIDVLESLNELEALEELLLEELILLEEPSTFEEVLAEENVILVPEEEEEEVEEVFTLEGYVIDSETELGIPHVEVYGGLLGREITDSDGYFSFINIPKSTYVTIGLDPDLGRSEPEIFSITISNNEMVRFFVTK